MVFDSMACRLEKVKNSKKFAPQTLSNVLYSFAISQRSNDELFEAFSPALVRLFGGKDSTAKAQEFSNVIWLYATAEVRGAKQTEFVALLADTMENRRDFVASFQGQAYANIAWGVAKLLVQSEEQGNNAQQPPPNGESSSDLNRDLAVVRILRQVAKAMVDQPGNF